MTKEKKYLTSKKYFFLNGVLHRKLHINRSQDEITAWRYSTESRVTYPYRATLLRMEPAFTTKQVADMMGHHYRTIWRAINSGGIETPQKMKSLSEKKARYKYMFSEADIMDLHAYLSSVHQGPPRKDGLITPMKLPSVVELRAMIRNEEIFYVKVGDTFQPTWKAPDF